MCGILTLSLVVELFYTITDSQSHNCAGRAPKFLAFSALERDSPLEKGVLSVLFAETRVSQNFVGEISLQEPISFNLRKIKTRS